MSGDVRYGSYDVAVRSSRLLSILLLLQTRGRMTAKDLATELEVSLRTIYRDVDSLAAAGVPLYGDRGPAGGYQLIDGYRTRLTGLNTDEAGSIFLAGVPGPAAELGLGTVLATAQLKLLAALPTELRSRAGRIRERFHLDAPGWFHSGEEAPHLALVAQAVWNQHRLRVMYRRPGGPTERLLDPLGVVLKSGVWYVVAARDGETRTYRVSRIEEAELLDERFERPETFDLVEYWTDSIAAYERDIPRLPVTIRLNPMRRSALSAIVGGTAVHDADVLPADGDPDGWMHLRMRMEWPEDAAARLVGLGNDLEVLEPAELRDQVLALARGTLARHGVSG
jgi:predicted DNA-binding transcriptional regulator YafY